MAAPISCGRWERHKKKGANWPASATWLFSLKARPLLRLFSIVLAVIYVCNLHRISRITTPHTANAPGPLQAFTDAHNFTRNDPAATSGSSGRVDLMPNSCADAVLRCYARASLLWMLILFSRRTDQELRTSLLRWGVVCLVAVASWSSPGDVCPILPELRTAVAADRIVALRTDAASLIGSSVRIAFTLHEPDDLDSVVSPDSFASRQMYKCKDGRSPLPPALARRTVLGFSASVRTDLNVGFVGDSIAAQFAQAFDAASLGPDVDDGRPLGPGRHRRRWAQLDEDDPKDGWRRECLAVSSPVQGGGTSAFWRSYGLMSYKSKRPYYHCDPLHRHEFGWAENQAHALMDRPRVDGRPFGISEGSPSRRVGAFDAFVIRITHGWLKLTQITREAIIEEINIIGKYLGVRTIIISTLPFCNNVKNRVDWKQMADINQMIRDLAHEWEAPPTGEHGVENVLVQEFGNFTNQIIWTNGRHIGYNLTMPDFSQARWEQDDYHFLFDRLGGQGKWPPSKAQVCASSKYWHGEFASGTMEQCALNLISVDGSHWCQNSLGPRHSASIACLLGCVYNEGETGSSSGTKTDGEVRDCERRCNEVFMSLTPVPERWIGTGSAIFSR